MICVPVPVVGILQPTNNVYCKVCYTTENIAEINQYGRAICNVCIHKRQRINVCLRCDESISHELPLTLNLHQMCNKCVCVDVCATTNPPTGDVRSTIFELCELVKMIRGELAIGQAVTLRPGGFLSQVMEDEYFQNNGEDIGIMFGAPGTIVSFTARESDHQCLLSSGSYGVLLENGSIINVLSACGLRYNGQKIEIRLGLTR